MQLTIKGRLYQGSTVVRPGNYGVSFNSESAEIMLSGHGETYTIKAIKRPCKLAVRTPTPLIFPASRNQWILIVRLTNKMELYALMRYEPAVDSGDWSK